VFCVEGWDDDPREIHVIPEVRRFYSAFHEAWPYWLYFCNLDGDTLRSMVMCCLPDVSTLQVDGQTKIAVTCDPLDLLNFIKHDFAPMNAMCERAEMAERGIYDRSKAVFEYFNFPFDAEPPPRPSATTPRSRCGGPPQSGAMIRVPAAGASSTKSAAAMRGDEDLNAINEGVTVLWLK